MLSVTLIQPQICQYKVVMVNYKQDKRQEIVVEASGDRFAEFKTALDRARIEHDLPACAGWMIVSQEAINPLAPF